MKTPLPNPIKQSISAGQAVPGQLLAGKVAVVTGASRGIGAETARELSRAGARVVLTARHKAALNQIASTLESPSVVIAADLLVPTSIASFISKTEKIVGTPDIIVNVAGVWHNKEERYQGPRFWEAPMDRVQEVLSVGLMASMRIAHGFLPGMVKRGSGHIVQIGCGFAGPHEASGWLHYYVTNRAISALTEGLAAELRPNRVHVNCVAPWFVATEYVKQFYKNESAKALSPRRVAEVIREIVAGSLSTDVSGQTIELRSDEDL